MPNYNYECQECHHVFEVTASIKDMEKGPFQCKKCGSKNTKDYLTDLVIAMEIRVTNLLQQASQLALGEHAL
jgi:putative FmdB family regulatory protein